MASLASRAVSKSSASSSGVAHRREDRDLVHLEALELPRLGEDLADADGVLGGRRVHRLVDGGLVDERSCLHNGCHALAPSIDWQRLGAVRRSRDLETELGPLALLGLRGDAALVQLDDAPRVVEADARAAAALEGRVVQAREPAEELVLLPLAEARPGVPHADAQALAALLVHPDLGLDADVAALVAVLDRVVEQVDGDDAQQRRVAADGRQGRRRNAGHEVDAVGVGLRADEVDRLGDHLFHHVDAGTRGEPELAALHPREVEVLAHEAEQVLPFALHAQHLGALLGREVAQIALGEDLGVGDHRGDRALQLVAHEPEHLRVGVVGLLELLDAPGLLDGLAEALGDRHLQLDVVGPVGVRRARAAEDEADDAALDDERAGEAGAHPLLDQQLGRAAARVVAHVGLEIVDDARQPAAHHLGQRAAAKPLAIALVDAQAVVGGAVVVAGDVDGLLVDEGEAHAVAGDELLGVVEEVVDDRAQGGAGGDLLVDRAQQGARLRAHRLDGAGVAERVDVGDGGWCLVLVVGH